MSICLEIVSDAQLDYHDWKRANKPALITSLTIFDSQLKPIKGCYDQNLIGLKRLFKSNISKPWTPLS